MIQTANDRRLDIIGIGNAIVDVLSRESDSFLDTHMIQKGGMTLIDMDRAEALYAAMGPGREVSGGSVANSTAGFAALGGKAGFIGKVRNDQLGQVFAHDIRAAGVTFQTPMATKGESTARCLIVVTADGQRSMSTYLGASQGLTEADIDPDYIASAGIVYLEGYLWDPAEAKKAFLKAMHCAREVGTKVALSLSDSFCVDRYRSEFLDLVDNHVDILFANEDEIKALYQTDHFDDAVKALGQKVELAALTRSEKGSVIIRGHDVAEIAAAPVDEVVDATGAGDLYAAGLLFACTRGLGLQAMGQVASLCAAEIISHYGARPEADLKRLVADAMAAA